MDNPHLQEKGLEQLDVVTRINLNANDISQINHLGSPFARASWINFWEFAGGDCGLVRTTKEDLTIDWHASLQV